MPELSVSNREFSVSCEKISLSDLPRRRKNESGGVELSGVTSAFFCPVRWPKNLAVLKVAVKTYKYRFRPLVP
jgi:hypothetical protein